jgi:MoaA/NifB/PqqE/SkfB family radical SAM enzyme
MVDSYINMFTTDSRSLVGITELRSKRSSDWFYIDWWLMNHCSWNCSYCHDIIKSGNIPLPNYKECRRFIYEAAAYAQSKNKNCYFSFTGGEVTQWSEFGDIINYAKDLNCYVKYRTNASSTRQYWTALLEHTDELDMEVHPEHTSLAHFFSLLGVAVDAGIRITVSFNMLKDQWQEMEELHDRIKQKYPSVFLHKKMLFQDPVFNTTPMDYDQEQRDTLKEQYKDVVFVDKGTATETNYQTIMLENKNQFKEWHCAAGVEQIVVDAWGKVYRGHCRFNGYLGSISDRVVWMQELAVCGVDYCKNGFDILATKQLLK